MLAWFTGPAGPARGSPAARGPGEGVPEPAGGSPAARGPGEGVPEPVPRAPRHPPRLLGERLHRPCVRQIPEAQLPQLQGLRDALVPLQQPGVLLHDAVVVAAQQHCQLGVCSRVDRDRAHVVAEEECGLAEPGTGPELALGRGPRGLLAALFNDVIVHVLQLTVHLHPPTDDKDDLLHELPLLHDQVPGEALHPGVRLRNLRDERMQHAPEQREVEHATAQQLQRDLSLHGRGQLAIERRLERQALLPDLVAEVVLHTTLKLGRQVPLPHEEVCLSDLYFDLVVEDALRDMRQQRDYGAEEDGRYEHREDGKKPREGAHGGDVAEPHSAHGHGNPIHVGHKQLPPLHRWVRAFRAPRLVGMQRQAPETGRGHCGGEDHDAHARRQAQQPVVLLPSRQQGPQAQEPHELQAAEHARGRRAGRHQRDDRQQVWHQPLVEVPLRNSSWGAHHLPALVEACAEVEADVQPPHAAHDVQEGHIRKVRGQIISMVAERNGDNGARHDGEEHHEQVPGATQAGAWM
mmetsp:Transcript_63056/g.184387  ORF Transcript_63056/g.184387 Transcript_63056/m.184387 type:complete len:520 (-) Transcript_63056:817-2376(-)